MRGPLGKTIAGLTQVRCMLVGLDAEQDAACVEALAPIALVRVDGAPEASERMSTVLPLLVVASRGLGEGPIEGLRDIADACAAELVVIDPGAPGEIAREVHEALRRSDRRRLRADRDDI